MEGVKAYISNIHNQQMQGKSLSMWLRRVFCDIWVWWREIFGWRFTVATLTSHDLRVPDKLPILVSHVLREKTVQWVTAALAKRFKNSNMCIALYTILRFKFYDIGGWGLRSRILSSTSWSSVSFSWLKIPFQPFVKVNCYIIYFFQPILVWWIFQN